MRRVLTHYSKAGFILFSTLSGELQHFHSDSKPQLGDKMLMQNIFRWPNRIVSWVKCSWSWTFFHSWSSIALVIAFWYQSIGEMLLTSKTEMWKWKWKWSKRSILWINTWKRMQFLFQRVDNYPKEFLSKMSFPPKFWIMPFWNSSLK